MLRARIVAAMLGIVAALAVAGCSETELVVNSSKLLTKPNQASGPPAYKIGQPYQVQNVWYYPKVDYGYDETGIASWYGPDFNGKPTASGEIYDQNGLTAAHKTLPLPTIVQVTNLENGRSLKLRINDRGPFVNGRIIDVSRRAAQLLGFHQNGTARVRVQVLADESMALASALTGGSGVPADQAQPVAPSAAPTMAVTQQQLPAGGSAAAASTGTAPATSTGNTAVTSATTRAVAAAEPDGRVTQTAVKPTRIFIQAGAFTQLANAQKLTAELSRLGAATMTPVTLGNQQFYRVRLGPIASVSEADRLLDKLVQSGHTEARIVVD
ncbi:MAG TPA: septal ring lytic transglycosylase RlpA family protein [Hypericibacter adhaerens]|uniref:septal ring lytic transglycosylase RlpA family protein n=1 Tax=Hypericibacter adhaerens TaxID=2602016 RepID=UPI002BAB42AF|nr:septal ring lytic transglycosylase RlpA family protein [Hypericibacter adhaerens]HWA44086.1 septal ring lytic transglycosylase RlpA family protein [Hypericibacter adhaerens]